VGKGSEKLLATTEKDEGSECFVRLEMMVDVVLFMWCVEDEMVCGVGVLQWNFPELV